VEYLVIAFVINFIICVGEGAGAAEVNVTYLGRCL
jgi:hypothetical protein